MSAKKTAVGGALMVGARLLTRFIDLATMLVLARILSPSDFGLVAIAISVVAIMESALELPVNQALVRLTDVTPVQFDTAFTISLLRGLLLGGVLLSLAVPFSHFYTDTRLFGLIVVLSVAPVARGLVSPKLVEYQRQISFWRDFLLEIGGKLIAFVLSVGIGIFAHSYWAIAIGSVAFPLASTIGSYCLAPYRPRISLKEFSIFKEFLGWMSLAQIVNAVNWQFERLLLGKLTSKTELGKFTASSDVASIPFLAFFGPLLRPFLANFARLVHDRQQIAESYLAASVAVVSIGLPLLVGESLTSEASVHLILGDKWSGAAELVRWLALSLIPALLALPVGPLIMAYGQTKLFLYRNLIEFAVKLPMAAVGAIYYGFEGVIVARFVSEAIASSYSMIAVRRLCGLPVSRQFFASWRTMVSTGVMVVPVRALLDMLPTPETAVDSAVKLLCAGFLGGVTYSISMALLWMLSGRPGGSVEAVAAGVIRRLCTTSRSGVNRARSPEGI